MKKLWGCVYHYLPVHIMNLLKQKRSNRDFKIPEVNEEDFYQFNPSKLPELSEVNTVDQVWYFFCKPKNIRGKNPVKLRKRAAGTGYWKITGKGCEVKNRNRKKIGSKKTLVFYIRNPGPSKDTKTNWVMHEFHAEDDPDFKENYVFCYIEKQPNKKPGVLSLSDGEPSSSLASVSVNQNVEGTSTEVEFQQVQSHLLISDPGTHVTENTSIEVPPQPVSTQNLVSNSRNYVANSTSLMGAPQVPCHYMVFDSTDHVAENTNSTVTKSMPSDSFQHQPMEDLPLRFGEIFASATRNFGTQNTFPLSGSSTLAEFGAFDGCNGLNHSFVSAPEMPINPEQVAPQVPSSNAMIFEYYSRSHVAENTFPMLKNMPYVSFHHQPMQVDFPPLSSQYSVSGSGNQVAEYTYSMSGSSLSAEFGAFNGCNVKKPCISTKNEDRSAKRPCVFFNAEVPSHNVACNDEIRNFVVENTSPESQCDSISNINHVAENISPELQPLPSCNSISDSGHYVADSPEYFSQVDPLLLAKSSVLRSCSELDRIFFSTLLSPINPEKGFSYSRDSVLQVDFSRPSINPEQGAYSSLYSNSFGKDSKMPSSHLVDEHEDVEKSQEDDDSRMIMGAREATGLTLPAIPDDKSIDMINELYEDISSIAFGDQN